MTVLQSFRARTGEPIGAPLAASTPAEIDATVEAAAQAFDFWRDSDRVQRAALLYGIAVALEGDRETLVPMADDETGLGPVRLNGELDRTVFQLRRFAKMCEDGVPYFWLDDPAVAGGPPAGHPDMGRVRVPLGPVAMFAASNFPFAFSVPGGDTASALAAGCSLVIKAHAGHPLTSQRVHGLMQQTLHTLHLPAGLIGMVQGAGNEIGSQLIQHPLIAAGAFTGSTRGGAALLKLAQARPRPIPFYGELGSINPIIALPTVLAAKGAELANTLAGSIALGCGQFCTSPGVIVLFRDPASDAFVGQLTAALSAQAPHAMLTSGMRKALDAGTAAALAAGARALLNEPTPDPAPRPFLAEVDAATFIAKHQLREEMFGPAALLVRVEDLDQAVQVLQAVGGSLTVTLWGAEVDTHAARTLVRAATSIAGRVLFAGVPTGVAVTSSQQHGGPWPSSTDPMTTSVGNAALNRFLRPVALQDAPDWLKAMDGRPV